MAYECHLTYGVPPSMFHPTAVRAFFGLKKSPDMDVKRAGFNFVAARLAAANTPVEWPWKRVRRAGSAAAAAGAAPLTAAPTTPANSIASAGLDMSDAYLVALYELVNHRALLLADDPALAADFAARWRARSSAGRGRATVGTSGSTPLPPPRVVSRRLKADEAEDARSMRAALMRLLVQQLRPVDAVRTQPQP